MEEVAEAETSWFDDFDYSQVEIMRELQEDTSSQFISSEVAESQSVAQQESIINKLISAAYSGPTISDIESALSLTFQSGDSSGRCSARPMYLPKPFLLRLHSAPELSCFSEMISSHFLAVFVHRTRAWARWSTSMCSESRPAAMGLMMMATNGGNTGRNLSRTVPIRGLLLCHHQFLPAIT